MSKEKQIEEMAKTMVDSDNKEVADALSLFFVRLAEALYTAGYRKQVVDANSATTTGEWKNNHCTNCGMMPMGEEMWTRLDLTPPRFEWFMNFCPNCGAHMQGEKNG